MAIAMFSVVGTRGGKFGDFEIEVAVVVDADDFAFEDLLEVA